MTPSPHNQKLREILDEYENGQNPKQSEEYRLTKASKALDQLYADKFLEIVGEDIDKKHAVRTHSDAGAGYTIGVNAFKKELRIKIKEALS